MAFSVDDLAVLGIRATFAGTDMGIIKNWSPSEDITEYRFEGARDGKNVIYKIIVLGGVLTYTFSSDNVLDPAILALYRGEGAAANLGLGATDGALTFTLPNADPGFPGLIFSHPLASLRRAGFGGDPGQNASQLNFQATVLYDEGTKSFGTLSLTGTTGATP